MNGNFNPMLNLKGSGTVDARGWLIWDADDESAKITVTVTQNGTTGTAKEFTCTPKDDTWKVDVTASGKYAYGSANGKAEAIVTKKPSSGPAYAYEYYWESPPLQLK
jgi:hypothetical protein